MTQCTIGIDISKAHLDVHLLPDGIASDNSLMTGAGFTELIKWIGKRNVERIVYEPTGAYHRAFEDALSKAGLPLAKVNPLQARRFAEARGTRAKTDKVDAEVLGCHGSCLEAGDLPCALKNVAQPQGIADRQAGIDQRSDGCKEPLQSPHVDHAQETECQPSAADRA